MKGDKYHGKKKKKNRVRGIRSERVSVSVCRLIKWKALNGRHY